MVVAELQQGLETARRDPHSLAEIQWSLLGETLRLCQQIPLYRTLAYCELQGPECFEQLPILLPQTLRLDLKRLSEHPGNVVSVFGSGGTLGHPKFIAYTQGDWNRAVEVTARSLAVVGFTSDDRIAIIQPFGLWSIGSVFLEAARLIGATALPWGIHLSDSDVLTLISSLHPTVLMGSPGNICRMTEKFQKANSVLVSQLGVRALILSGESTSPSRRAYLNQTWDARILSLYGSAETDSLGMECEAGSGHHVWADQFILEVEGWGCLKPGDGPVSGNLLVSTLTREATPLLRYRLGDVVRADWLPCPCGITHPKVEPLGRCDGALILADGTTLHAYQIEEALASFNVPILAAQSMVQKAEGRDCLTVRIVPQSDLTVEDLEILRSLVARASVDFADAVEAGAIAPPIVEVVSFSELQQSRRGKTFPIIDLRQERELAETYT